MIKSRRLLGVDWLLAPINRRCATLPHLTAPFRRPEGWRQFVFRNIFSSFRTFRRCVDFPSWLSAAVPIKNFLAGSWATTAIAVAFLIARIYIRVRASRRLYWDDAILGFGALMVVLAAGLWQWAAPTFWFILDVGAGKAMPDDLMKFLKDVERTMRVFFVEQFFFYTALACVKLSLLFFFRRVGWHMTKLRLAWWCVLGLVVACWLTSIGDSQWGCLVATGFDIMSQCTEPPAIAYANLTLRINCALDVVSDAAVLSIPIILIWGTTLRTGKKLAFIGLFSLTLVTMLVAVLRVVGISTMTWENGQIDPSYLWLWSSIETCIAIIVACLTAFPQLFVSSKSPIVYMHLGPSNFHGSGGSKVKGGIVQSYADVLDTRVHGDEENFNYYPPVARDSESHSTTNLKPASIGHRYTEPVELHGISPLPSPYCRDAGHRQHRYH
ncbi:hypothetical protein QBC35DRAFT_540491 [Podospora australis]|uniref:Rhodopsin domain-containing protein n=1 Tax=Podospora australis TaxID=1536484 RepID=A0AAN6WN51_9PEZI|nr:hypothetical protein QBC35DRAFT_540491 [Podospora australis]